MSSERIEKVILVNLVKNESYARKALPFLAPEYFGNQTERVVFNKIRAFILEFNGLPTRDAVLIGIEKDKESFVGEEEYKKALDYTKILYKVDLEPNESWLITETESFCKDRAIYNAVYNTINILEGKDKNKSRGTIPQLLSEALAVSFDPNIGHNYVDDTEERFKYYHRQEEVIPCDLDMLNKMTNGGVTRKTLNVFMAGTNVGKSMILCHLAACYLTQGCNVLYITLEMSEEKIAQRIDANLLNTPVKDLKLLSKEVYDRKVSKMKEKVAGKLIIKEYPTASASVTHFRHLLNELHLKKNFVPDIIMIDYINICASSRIKPGSNTNSYQYVKSIAEEIRGLGVETNTAIWSATQTNRSGFNNTDMGMEDTSESFGLPMTADVMVGLIRTDELDEMNQLIMKQLKNRDNDTGTYRKFVVGVDRPKMRFYDVEQKAQDDLIETKEEKRKKKKAEAEDKPAFDNTAFGQGMKAEKNGRAVDDISLD